MGFTEEDKAFIENMYLIKSYGLRRKDLRVPSKGIEKVCTGKAFDCISCIKWRSLSASIIAAD